MQWVQTAPMSHPIVLVALGGAIGAVLRYLTGLWVLRFAVQFPLPILTVNILGSFLMGVCVVALGRTGLSHLSPLLMTGILGGFTTFSAFSLEAYTLFERGEVGSAALYVALSVVLSILGLVLGVALARGFFA